MDEATRALNVLSAVIMVVTGVYIQQAFGTVLSPTAVGVLWMTVAIYSGLQFEHGYNFLRRKRRSDG